MRSTLNWRSMLVENIVEEILGSLKLTFYTSQLFKNTKKKFIWRLWKCRIHRNKRILIVQTIRAIQHSRKSLFETNCMYLSLSFAKSLTGG